MFSLPGTYEAVGILSLQHIVAAVICLALVGVFVYINRKMTAEQFHNRIRIYAIVITLLELFKIAWCLANHLNHPHQWVPLWFCSLFIYALWLASANNKHIKELGFSYLAMAGIICGFVFIMCPTTSLRIYPIFHFQCLYSLFFHSMMVYCGVMVFATRSIKMDIKYVYRFWIFCSFFILIAVTLNITLKTNLMFFDRPNNIPLPFLFTIYEFSPVVYTIVMIVTHLSLGIIVYLINKLISYVHLKRKTLSIELEEDEKPIKSKK